MARRALAAEFPRAREGILYAAHRLRQDPSLTLPDIRDDAEATGVKIGGRSLHSARTLLNGTKGPAVVADQQRSLADQQRSLADQLRRLVADFEREAAREVQRLRAAVEEAVNILERALLAP